jgi:hypothetical protein
MKELIKILALVAVLFNYSAAHAEKDTDVKSLKTLLTHEKLSSEDIDKAYNTLDKLVAIKVGMTMKDLLELCVLYSKHDTSDAASDFAINLKKSNPKEFQKALKELSKEDKAKIKEFIKLAEEEEKNGNG